MNSGKCNIQLYPTHDQAKEIIRYCSAARVIYNICLDEEKSHLEKTGPDSKLIGKIELMRRLMYHITCDDKLYWLKDDMIDFHTIEMICSDIIISFNAYQSNQIQPRYRSQTYSKQSFPTKNERFSIDMNGYLNMNLISEKIGCVKMNDDYKKIFLHEGEVRFVYPRIFSINKTSFFFTSGVVYEDNDKIDDKLISKNIMYEIVKDYGNECCKLGMDSFITDKRDPLDELTHRYFNRIYSIINNRNVNRER